MGVASVTLPGGTKVRYVSIVQTPLLNIDCALFSLLLHMLTYSNFEISSSVVYGQPCECPESATAGS